MTTKHELEAAKTWVDMRKLDDNSPQMVAIIETLSYALTQALEIAKGGKVVVPLEPTSKMIDAGISKFSCCDNGIEYGYEQIYKAMITAAQEGKG